MLTQIQQKLLQALPKTLRPVKVVTIAPRNPEVTAFLRRLDRFERKSAQVNHVVR